MDRLLPEARGKVLADVGVGWGDYLPFFVERGFTVLAIDKRLCDLHRIASCNDDGSPVVLVAADANCLPIGSGSINVVFMGQILEHLVEPSRALDEANRVLRTRGYLFIDVPWLHQVYTPLSAMALRLLRQYRATGKLPLVLRFLFSEEADGIRSRAYLIHLIELVGRWPLLRGVRPEVIIGDYIRGREADDYHRQFLFPNEWKRLVERAGFSVKLVTGAWVTPPLLGRFRLANYLFRLVEKKMPDVLLSRISRILIIVGEKRR